MNDDRQNRKVRTRGHIIADLAVNVVERQILLAGYTMERKVHDYGLDTHMTTHDPAGVVENEVVWFQIKATDHLQTTADGRFALFRVESADLRYWLFELMPVILAVYAAVAERVLWLDVQAYAVANDLDADEVGETVTLRIPTSALFDVPAVRVIRERKEDARKSARRS